MKIIKNTGADIIEVEALTLCPFIYEHAALIHYKMRH